MKKIGITGNIASGKSQVEKIIANKGYKVFDLDEISHYILDTNKDVQKLILNEFSTVSRKELGKIVFSDNNKLIALEKIVYPVLIDEIKRLFLKCKSENIIFISGALIFDKGFDVLFDKIIYVDSLADIRLKRLMARNNLSEVEARKRMSIQKDYRYKANYIIENNSDLLELEKDVIKLLELL